MNLKRKCHAGELGWEKVEANSIIGISSISYNSILRLSSYKRGVFPYLVGERGQKDVYFQEKDICPFWPLLI